MNYAWSFVFFVMAVNWFLLGSLYHQISLKRDHRYAAVSIGKWVIIACAFACVVMAYIVWTVLDPRSITYTNGTDRWPSAADNPTAEWGKEVSP